MNQARFKLLRKDLDGNNNYPRRGVGNQDGCKSSDLNQSLGDCIRRGNGFGIGLEITLGGDQIN